MSPLQLFIATTTFGILVCAKPVHIRQRPLPDARSAFPGAMGQPQVWSDRYARQGLGPRDPDGYEETFPVGYEPELELRRPALGAFSPPDGLQYGQSRAWVAEERLRQALTALATESRARAELEAALRAAYTDAMGRRVEVEPGFGLEQETEPKMMRGLGRGTRRGIATSIRGQDAGQEAEDATEEEEEEEEEAETGYGVPQDAWTEALLRLLLQAEFGPPSRGPRVRSRRSATQVGPLTRPPKRDWQGPWQSDGSPMSREGNIQLAHLESGVGLENDWQKDVQVPRGRGRRVRRDQGQQGLIRVKRIGVDEEDDVKGMNDGEGKDAGNALRRRRSTWAAMK
uniref:uncharacterized protein n=1 Tax=Myxine glutinosa TaxID=7769 RepID=UPI0035902093